MMIIIGAGLQTSSLLSTTLNLTTNPDLSRLRPLRSPQSPAQAAMDRLYLRIWDLVSWLSVELSTIRLWKKQLGEDYPAIPSPIRPRPKNKCIWRSPFLTRAAVGLSNRRALAAAAVSSSTNPSPRVSERRTLYWTPPQKYNQSPAETDFIREGRTLSASSALLMPIASRLGKASVFF
jgi:hypothetical protein